MPSQAHQKACLLMHQVHLNPIKLTIKMNYHRVWIWGLQILKVQTVLFSLNVPGQLFHCPLSEQFSWPTWDSVNNSHSTILRMTWGRTSCSQSVIRTLQVLADLSPVVVWRTSFHSHHLTILLFHTRKPGLRRVHPDFLVQRVSVPILYLTPFTKDLHPPSPFSNPQTRIPKGKSLIDCMRQELLCWAGVCVWTGLGGRQTAQTQRYKPTCGAEEEGTAVLRMESSSSCGVGVQIPCLFLMSQLKIKPFQAPC